MNEIPNEYRLSFTPFPVKHLRMLRTDVEDSCSYVASALEEPLAPFKRGVVLLSAWENRPFRMVGILRCPWLMKWIHPPASVPPSVSTVNNSSVHGPGIRVLVNAV